MQHLRQHQRLFVSGSVGEASCRVPQVVERVQLAKTHPANADNGLIEKQGVLVDAEMLGVGMSCGDYEDAPVRGANLSDANLAHARLGVADRGGDDNSPSLSLGGRT